MRFTYFLLCSLFLSACGVRTQPESNERAQSPTIQEQPKKDNWQRMKECAEQAERMIRSQGIVVGKQKGDSTITGYEDHYSQKYERCFMTTSTINYAAGTPGNPTLVITTTDLYDAFEGKLLATSANATAWEDCYIEGIRGSISHCDEADAFIKDRMQN